MLVPGQSTEIMFLSTCIGLTKNFAVVCGNNRSLDFSPGQQVFLTPGIIAPLSV